MIAALIGSQKPGRTAWIARRGTKAVHVTGMQDGDIVILHFPGGKVEIFHNGVYEIPDNVEAVRIEHSAASGSRVFVDLR